MQRSPAASERVVMSETPDSGWKGGSSEIEIVILHVFSPAVRRIHTKDSKAWSGLI